MSALLGGTISVVARQPLASRWQSLGAALAGRRHAEAHFDLRQMVRAIESEHLVVAGASPMH